MDIQNQGTVDLQKVLEAFQNMTVEEYEKLYKQAVEREKNLKQQQQEIVN